MIADVIIYVIKLIFKINKIINYYKILYYSK
jgi:hypothetical protein